MTSSPSNHSPEQPRRAVLVDSSDTRWEELHLELKESGKRVLLHEIARSGQEGLLTDFCDANGVARDSAVLVEVLESVREEGKLHEFVLCARCLGIPVSLSDYWSLLQSQIQEWETGGQRNGQRLEHAVTVLVEELVCSGEKISAEQHAMLLGTIRLFLDDHTGRLSTGVVAPIASTLRFLWNDLTREHQDEFLEKIDLLPQRVFGMHLTSWKQLAVLDHLRPLVELGAGLRKGIMLQPGEG